MFAGVVTSADLQCQKEKVTWCLMVNNIRVSHRLVVKFFETAIAGWDRKEDGHLTHIILRIKEMSSVKILPHHFCCLPI